MKILSRLEESPGLRPRAGRITETLSKEASPLYGETAESLVARRAEIVVVMRGLDETFAQTIHARSSYTPDEIVWGGRLHDIFSRDTQGRPVIDYTHFHDID